MEILGSSSKPTSAEAHEQVVVSLQLTQDLQNRTEDEPLDSTHLEVFLYTHACVFIYYVLTEYSNILSCGEEANAVKPPAKKYLQRSLG